MKLVRRCFRCGHLDYEHEHNCCLFNRCERRCTPTLAEYGEPFQIATYDIHGRIITDIHK